MNPVDTVPPASRPSARRRGPRAGSARTAAPRPAPAPRARTAPDPPPAGAGPALRAAQPGQARVRIRYSVTRGGGGGVTSVTWRRACRPPAPRPGPRRSSVQQPGSHTMISFGSSTSGIVEPGAPRCFPGLRPDALRRDARARLAVGRIRARGLARGRRILPSRCCRSSAICAACASNCLACPAITSRSPAFAARSCSTNTASPSTEDGRRPGHQPMIATSQARSSRHTERGDHPSSPPRRPAQLRVTDASPRNQGSRPSRERGREVAARSLRRCILINPPIPLRAAELCSHDG